jgi:(p)ppGpp synthase/HD superfamily hydrolase
VIALRVVVSGNKHDCYQAQRVVQGLYRCMPERSKDFVRVIKKANGYQSLHETIYGEEDLPVEVQVSLLQHCLIAALRGPMLISLKVLKYEVSTQ